MKKEMLINVLQPEECRIAIVEDGILEELYVERTSLESFTGNIYKGKVVNLEPAIQAAFVDFSVGRNGFLHVSDVEPQYYHRHTQAEEVEPDPREGRREREERRRSRPDERERPDLSERGRRDRSERRRFGEGLTDDDGTSSPPAPPSPVEAERAGREEPREILADIPISSWAEGPPYRPTSEPESHRTDLDEPRSRIGR